MSCKLPCIIIGTRVRNWYRNYVVVAFNLGRFHNPNELLADVRTPNFSSSSARVFLDELVAR